MAKITRSVRMSEDTTKKLKELSELLKEKEPEIIEKAIDYFYDIREAVYEKDVEERRKRLKGNQ